MVTLAPFGARIGRLWERFRLAGPRSGVVSSHSSPIPDGGPTASLRDPTAASNRAPDSAGVVADRVSRDHRGWCARCRPVVRVFPRTVLLEVCQDGTDGCGFLDAGDDPHRAAAVDAGGHVDGEDPLEALRPGHRAALLLGAARLLVGADLNRCSIGRRPLAAPRRCQLRTQGGVRGKHAVKPGQVRARPRPAPATGWTATARCRPPAGTARAARQARRGDWHASGCRRPSPSLGRNSGRPGSAAWPAA